MAKTCKRCGETHIKAEKYFYKDRTRKDGLQPCCIECAKKATAYYEEKGKPPKEKRTCEYSKCNNTFKTRKPNKKFCCNSCNSKAYQERKGLEDVRFRQNFLKKLNRKKEERPNSHKLWSFEDIEILMDKRKEGIKFKDIGKILGRSSESCLNKYFVTTKKRNAK